MRKVVVRIALGCRPEDVEPGEWRIIQTRSRIGGSIVREESSQFRERRNQFPIIIRWRAAFERIVVRLPVPLRERAAEDAANIDCHVHAVLSRFSGVVLVIHNKERCGIRMLVQPTSDRYVGSKLGVRAEGDRVIERLIVISIARTYLDSLRALSICIRNVYAFVNERGGVERYWYRVRAAWHITRRRNRRRIVLILSSARCQLIGTVQRRTGGEVLGERIRSTGYRCRPIYAKSVCNVRYRSSRG